MPANIAAWLRKKNDGLLTVGPAPYPHPREHEIVVRNYAVAVNPADWIIEIMGGLIYPWLTYPAVLGSDAAGEVVEAGSAVTRFRAGDRVLGHAVGVEKDRNAAAEGAFQTYTVLLDHMTTPIPDHISYEQAAVLPLGVSTAACGLFEKDLLGLRLPVDQAPPTGETVLVWGGSTSVGSNAIQLAVAAGYDVITTASPRNFEYVQSLGARQAFDYRFPREVISVAVRWYLRYGLSYRDVEELLAERGVTVDHVTVYRWVQRFTPEFIEAARFCRHAPGDRWFADETYVKVAGRWTYLYRAIDQHGQVIDVLLSARRDLAAARRFFTRALRAGTIPAEVTTDRAPAYPRVLDELIPSALHTVERYANNPVESDHGRLKARLRPMRGLKRRRSARILAAGHAFVQNLRRGHYELATDVLARHRLRAAFDQLAPAI